MSESLSPPNVEGVWHSSTCSLSQATIDTDITFQDVNSVALTFNLKQQGVFVIGSLVNPRGVLINILGIWRAVYAAEHISDWYLYLTDADSSLVGILTVVKTDAYKVPIILTSVRYISGFSETPPLEHERQTVSLGYYVRHKP